MNRNTGMQPGRPDMTAPPPVPMLLSDYEAFYNLPERPFSLTADPRFHFHSRSHARASELLAFGLRRREGLLLITGKTTLGRALAAQAARRAPAAFVPHPLLTPEDFLRLVVQETGAASAREAWEGRLGRATRQELHEALAAHFGTSAAGEDVVVVVIDDAHRVPPAIVAELIALEGVGARGRPIVQVVLVGEAAAGTAASLANRQLDQRVVTRVRLLPLERGESGDYLAHRLQAAGGESADLFLPRAVDAIHDLSGGIPRLVNLLAERALHEGAVVGARRIAPYMIERAAVALELTHARPRRFRWFDG